MSEKCTNEEYYEKLPNQRLRNLYKKEKYNGLPTLQFGFSKRELASHLCMFLSEKNELPFYVAQKKCLDDHKYSDCKSKNNVSERVKTYNTNTRNEAAKQAAAKKAEAAKQAAAQLAAKKAEAAKQAAALDPPQQYKVEILKYIPTKAFRIGKEKWSLRQHQIDAINEWKVTGKFFKSGFSIKDDKMMYLDTNSYINEVSVDYHAIGQMFREIYYSGFAFPESSLTTLQKKEVPLSILYYHSEDSFAEILQLSIERDPVRFVNHFHQKWQDTTPYNKEMLDNLFGWKEGAYAKSTKETLQPNFAIFCKPEITHNGQKKRINVINLIGYALDHPEQPDYKHIIHKTKPTDSGIYEKCRVKHVKEDVYVDFKYLEDLYFRAWCFAFECATHQKLKQVQYIGLGAGAFNPFPGDTFRQKIEEPVIKRLKATYPDINLWNPNEMFWVPKDFFNSKLSEPQIQEILFVNAWDPWSMVGNGNESDGSLDGYYGRSTNMAVLSWPLTNPNFQFCAVTLNLDQLL